MRSVFRGEKVGVLIVLYASEPESSKTFQSICGLPNFIKERLYISIWNNGPEKIDPSFLEDGVTVIQTPENISLAAIYNRYIESHDYPYYAIFDQDTCVNELYFRDLFSFWGGDLFLPRLYAAGRVRYPVFEVGAGYPFIKKYIPKRNERYEGSDKFFVSIASGIVISSTLVDKLKSAYGEVFDEAFWIYGVDTSFFYRLRFHDLKVCVGAQVNHDLSRLTVGMTRFSLVERLSENVLMLRLYPSVRNVVRCFRFVAKNIAKLALSDLKMAVKIFLTAKHPR